MSIAPRRIRHERNWKSSEPIANYLVENSVGNFDYSFRTGANDVVYFEAQDSGIAGDVNTPGTRKALNKLAMDGQEDITHFQEGINGQFPFSANGKAMGLDMMPNREYHAMHRGSGSSRDTPSRSKPPPRRGKGG